MNVHISISKHITENFKMLKVPFKKLVDLMGSDYNYSAGSFIDGYRNMKNYANFQDIIILDVDDGLTLKEAKNIFEPFTYIIATTKSHQKEKNNIVCDRYRILLPLEKQMKLTSVDYSDTMVEVMKEYNFVDKSCKDSSRFYYPAKDSQVIYHSGFIEFDWIEYYNKAIQNRKARDEERQRLKAYYENMNKRKEHDYNFEMEHIDVIRNLIGKPKLLEILKFDKFGAGGRNNYLYSVGRYFQDLGFEDEEIKNAILWINSCGDGLTENEIVSTIFKSLRVL